MRNIPWKHKQKAAASFHTAKRVFRAMVMAAEDGVLPEVSGAGDNGYGS
ncbi:hypothetical protein ACO4HK_005222 [Escherichia coli]|jgi:hypothetical protein|nr:hypothetical protein [Escherichia coli]EEZ5766765.1 hypothetical protein [Escherichia coli O140]EGW94688.1 hypothetical protein ECSTECDG1313_1724 [Escherichia coli STEC_DG131-3]EKM2601257.1 hypothetical protein [Escherichia coli O157]EQZ53783.1 hypothetical protein G983_02228 [Escherichia coli UMEA 3656-1]HDQ6483860.1 hypothetical protein [Escherichia coli O87:H16]